MKMQDFMTSQHADLCVTRTNEKIKNLMSGSGCMWSPKVEKLKWSHGIKLMSKVDGMISSADAEEK